MQKTPSLHVRPPVDEDDAAIAALLHQLGYPSTPEEVRRRLQPMRADTVTSVMWVAELDGAVVGLATAKRFPSIHVTAPIAWLTVLVVDERARGRGVGSKLVAVAEDWARAQGATRLSLTSAVHRVEAHEFYVRLGYQQTGVRLAKIFAKS